MKGKSSDTCYACDQPATTREHAPPRSFFPQGYRTNLITVPSCEVHNNDNSKDVEYTRNVISVSNGVNRVGDEHFLDKGVASLEHTPALLYATFSDIRPIMVDGVEVGAYTMDVDRVKNVMNACLCALNFRETGKKIPTWEVVLPNLGLQNATPEEIKVWQEAFGIFLQVPYQARTTGSPDVFQYAVGKVEGGHVYAMRFYRGFDVYGAAPE
ncbi:MAG: hypothetical protein ACLQHT_05415 [Terracidiphilus sp.]